MNPNKFVFDVKRRKYCKLANTLQKMKYNCMLWVTEKNLFPLLFSAQSLPDEVSLESSEGDELRADQKLRGKGGGDRGGGGLREGRDYHQHQAKAQEHQHLL